MLIAPRSWRTLSAAMVQLADAAAARRGSFAKRGCSRWTVRIISSCSATAVAPNGIVGLVDEGSTLGQADGLEQVDGPAAAALDVVGVDAAPADGGERLLERRGLPDPVGVERHLDVVALRDRERGVDERGVGADVLVHLEAARARARAAPRARPRPTSSRGRAAAG